MDGIVNYIITRLSINLIKRDSKPRYKILGRIIMALEMAKLEMYNRLVTPYEVEVAKKNGDIPEYGV